MQQTHCVSLRNYIFFVLPTTNLKMVTFFEKKDRSIFTWMRCLLERCRVSKKQTFFQKKKKANMFFLLTNVSFLVWFKCVFPRHATIYIFLHFLKTLHRSTEPQKRTFVQNKKTNKWVILSKFIFKRLAKKLFYSREKAFLRRYMKLCDRGLNNLQKMKTLMINHFTFFSSSFKSFTLIMLG